MKDGVYMVPGLAPDLYEEAAATAAYSAKAVANPNATIINSPVGRDGMQMGRQLAIEFATCFLAGLLAAWLMNLAASGFGKRVAISPMLGLFAWLVISVPYWNCFRFPLELTIGSLIMTMVGWFLAGLPISWWLGRQKR